MIYGYCPLFAEGHGGDGTLNSSHMDDPPGVPRTTRLFIRRFEPRGWRFGEAMLRIGLMCSGNPSAHANLKSGSYGRCPQTLHVLTRHSTLRVINLALSSVI